MKLKAQSSKLKTSPIGQAPIAEGGRRFGTLNLKYLLSFELWILSFRSFRIPHSTFRIFS